MKDICMFEMFVARKTNKWWAAQPLSLHSYVNVIALSLSLTDNCNILSSKMWFFKVRYALQYSHCAKSLRQSMA